MAQLHLLKLSVGTDSVEDLADWQDSQAARWPNGCAVHVTRMWPKREAELLDGGSIYWIIKGVILCRQRLVALERVEGGDGISRCALVMDREILRTQAAPRRPFQGWRYLDPTDAPRDLTQGRINDDVLPEELARALADIGLR
ncbi:MAG: DUF1489 domain-containing protein [Paracoccaceae bacterium]